MFVSDKKIKGFTLIELLVVISIIVLFVSVCLVGITYYRDKAKDARIGATLSQLRTEAEIIYSDENQYTNICDKKDTLNDGYTKYPSLAIIEEEIEGLSDRKPDCYASDMDYCVQTILITKGYYCIDSGGVALEIDKKKCAKNNIKCADKKKEK